MAKGKPKLRIRENHLAIGLLKWSYHYALQRKNEWLDLPEFIRGTKTFSIYLENLLIEKAKMARVKD